MTEILRVDERDWVVVLDRPGRSVLMHAGSEEDRVAPVWVVSGEVDEVALAAIATSVRVAFTAGFSLIDPETIERAAQAVALLMAEDAHDVTGGRREAFCLVFTADVSRRAWASVGIDARTGDAIALAERARRGRTEA